MNHSSSARERKKSMGWDYGFRTLAQRDTRDLNVESRDSEKLGKRLSDRLLEPRVQGFGRGVRPHRNLQGIAYHYSTRWETIKSREKTKPNQIFSSLRAAR